MSDDNTNDKKKVSKAAKAKKAKAASSAGSAKKATKKATSKTTKKAAKKKPAAKKAAKKSVTKSDSTPDSTAKPKEVRPVNTANTTSTAPQKPRPLAVAIGEKLFQWRDYTPIPLIVIVLWASDPSVFSATLGTLVAIFGELFRIYAVGFIGSVSRTRNSETTGGALITNGPFGWMRNPLYVGNFFIVFGLAIFGGDLFICLLASGLFAAQYYCIVSYEEELLKTTFGETYATYMKSVPAWVPKKMPSIKEMEWPETLSPALRSEKRTLTAIVVMLGALMLFG